MLQKEMVPTGERLTPEMEVEILHGRQGTEEEKTKATRQFFEAIAPMIAKVAGTKMSVKDPAFQDLYADGVVAALQALDSFDPKKTTKLSTFVYKALDRRLSQDVRKYVGRGDTPYYESVAAKIQKARVEISQKSGVDMMAVTPQQISDFYCGNISIATVINTIAGMGGVTANHTDPEELLSGVSASDDYDPEKKFLKDDSDRRVMEAINSLNELHKFIFLMMSDVYSEPKSATSVASEIRKRGWGCLNREQVQSLYNEAKRLVALRFCGVSKKPAANTRSVSMRFRKRGPQENFFDSYD